ncbi:Rrf2 family transcriptional regulator [bacterium]|nr:Rrf2 family transcriptional regulator [bacterium]
MSTIFSKPMGYALRAMIHLAERRDDGPILASVIAEREDIPAPFLGKVMGKLAQAGFVDSMRGPNGGYHLIREPETITLRDISELFETQASGRECLLGWKTCPGPKYCAVHQRWLEPQRHIDRFLDGTTLGDIVAGEQKRRQKLKRA